MLYLRSLISIVISLYTSRVILNALGVDDYGIYTIVGGVVSIFTFLNSSMSNATSRFITYELGRGDFKRLNLTFNTAILVHFGIALVVFLLCETVGLWLFMNKLVINPERMYAAHWVYQLSILAMVIKITQVPYGACIIAHEKMDIYAYMEIFNVSSKLAVVFFLLYSTSDKLILFAVLTLLITCISAAVYRWYCIKRFPESKLNIKWDWNSILPMLKFTSYNLYGDMCGSFRQQGVNILQNINFGTVVNAAIGVTDTVVWTINGLVSNIVTAFRPQIIKSYASKEFDAMISLFDSTLKFAIAFYLVIVIPIHIEADKILELWLKIVPEYAPIFMRLFLMSSFFVLLNTIILIPLHASGDIKTVSFISGTMTISSLIPTYIAFKCGLGPEYAYYILLIFCFLSLIINSTILYKRLRITSLITSEWKVVNQNLFVIALCYFVGTQIQLFFAPSIFRVLLIFAVNFAIYSICFFLMLSKSQRTYVITLIKTKYHSIFKV